MSWGEVRPDRYVASCRERSRTVTRFPLFGLRCRHQVVWGDKIQVAVNVVAPERSDRDGQVDHPQSMTNEKGQRVRERKDVASTARGPAF